MNWINNMNNALEYIESNLDRNITLDEIAKIAYSSKFHFNRTFSILTGMNLFDYIRCRRLTVCVKDLKDKDSKVIDVALKYGYESPEAFSRAFKKLHNITPSKVKNYEGKFNATLPLSISVVLKGDEKMNYKIVEKESFSIVGYKKKVTTKDGENFKIIPKFWNEVMSDGSFEQLAMQAGPLGAIGACANHNAELEEFDYFIAVEGKKLENVDEQESLVIDKCKWAIFESIGPMPDAIQKVWKKIYSEWFPATKYEHAGTTELEVYLGGDSSADDYLCEIWIPIVDK